MPDKTKKTEDCMLSFECPIYLDTLSLLLSDKTDILSEVKGQIMQGDPCMDYIKDDLLEKTEEDDKIDVNNLETIYDDDDINTLMKYITYDENGIEFDYGEAYACDDRRLGVYKIPCFFNATKYIQERYFAENSNN